MHSGIEIRNLIIAFALSVGIMFVWQLTMPAPPPPQQDAGQGIVRSDGAISAPQITDREAAPKAFETKQDALAASAGRVRFNHDKMHGSIALTGARFDDITLADYHTELSTKSPEVTLLAPSGTPKRYFADFGWVSKDSTIALPNRDTVWQADKETISVDNPVTLSWDNGEGLRFTTIVSMDENYMFTLTRRVTNTSGRALPVAGYGLINHTWHEPEEQMNLIMHEGPFGVFNNTLEEVDFSDLHGEPITHSHTSNDGWTGISEKYWFTAMIPVDEPFTARFTYRQREGEDRFQVEYVGRTHTIEDGQAGEITEHFYAGPKIVSLLDAYAERYNIPLFDRAVDFGLLYFLTKPFYQALKFFQGIFGNFGLAIMALTVVIRLILFPLANKSYTAMAKMRNLQPKMLELRERYSDDKMRMNQEIMALYQKEKVNPMAGCLPILVQLPIFFALYKVLYVTIEMRHAPFYGWINDLSAPDPTSIFTLFGLIPLDLPQFLTIGAWPIIMALTMVIQQRLSPPPPDPTQAMVMKTLPFIFLFLFAHFPAGLVIYWAWNNTLSVLQQYIILRRHGDERVSKKKNVAKEA